jgi:hypothetical protein
MDTIARYFFHPPVAPPIEFRSLAALKVQVQDLATLAYTAGFKDGLLAGAGAVLVLVVLALLLRKPSEVRNEP